MNSLEWASDPCGLLQFCFFVFFKSRSAGFHLKCSVISIIVVVFLLLLISVLVCLFMYIGCNEVQGTLQVIVDLRP